MVTPLYYVLSVRTKEYPEGRLNVSDKEQDILNISNRITKHTFALASNLVANDVMVSVENPTSSLRGAKFAF
jgi:hypothetical protein